MNDPLLEKIQHAMNSYHFDKDKGIAHVVREYIQELLEAQVQRCIYAAVKELRRQEYDNQGIALVEEAIRTCGFVYPKEKPPVGVVPRWKYIEDRILDLNTAIERYENAGYDPPKEWNHERIHLESELRNMTREKDGF